MRIIDRFGKCSIEIEHHTDETGAYDSFLVNATVDIGHGAFKAVNNDLQFLNLQTFVSDLDSFILDRTIKPRLEGTYDSYIEFWGTPSAVTVSFCIGDAFSGYNKVNTRFVFTGSFDIEQELLPSTVELFQELLG